VHLHMFDKAAENLDSLRTTLAGEVQGLVVANDGDITPEMVIQLEALQLPLVLVESYLPGQQLPCVLGDNFTAGYTVMEHLIERGHRSIAILRGPRKYSSLNDRLKGCFAAAAEAETAARSGAETATARASAPEPKQRAQPRRRSRSIGLMPGPISSLRVRLSRTASGTLQQ